MDKILVVEDDKTVYSGIKKLLEIAALQCGNCTKRCGGFGKNR